MDKPKLIELKGGPFDGMWVTIQDGKFVEIVVYGSLDVSINYGDQNGF